MSRGRSRRRERAYARRHGYFWLPCPLCGEEFGGHEWFGGSVAIEGDPGSWSGICAQCTSERQTYLEQLLIEGHTEGKIGFSRGRDTVWHTFPYKLPR